MQGYNCIMIYNVERDKLLFCKRMKEPYKGLYNFVGGKIELEEDGFTSAYRELYEETGIRSCDVKLNHMMDLTYYNQDCYIEVYVGYLQREIELKEELHPLYWLELNEDFFNMNRFAGEGNIGHIVEQVVRYGSGTNTNEDAQYQNKLDKNSLSIGVDGCKGGWIVASIDHGTLKVEKMSSISEIVMEYTEFDNFLIDMVIGLPSNTEQIRPDSYARQIIKERSSTIFPVPCRQAIYAESVAEAYEENVRVLGKKFTPLTVGIMPKIRELDSFLQEHDQYKNVILESHPEVCFTRLNGKTVLSKKSEYEGVVERVNILKKFLPNLDVNDLMQMAKQYQCNVDDIADAICLSVTANLAKQGLYEIIPERPRVDDTGLKMQMVIGKISE
jgi:predicted RNase H-like nuclease